MRDAREHGVEVRPVCVNASTWDCRLEPGSGPGSGQGQGGALALRLGFRQIKGISKEDADWIVAARGNGYRVPEDLRRRAGAASSVLERLAEADAFAALGFSRRQSLWAVKALRAPPERAETPSLFSAALEGEGIRELDPALPISTLGEEVVEDYVALRLSLRAHPLALLRAELSGRSADAPKADAAAQKGRGFAAPAVPLPQGGQGSERGGEQRPAPAAVPHGNLPETPDKAVIAVAGLVITRQRPGTASGVIFLTLEDETGVANVIVWPKTYERFRRAVIAGRLLRVTGKLQREGIVTHLIAWRIEDLSAMLDRLHCVDALGAQVDPTWGGRMKRGGRSRQKRRSAARIPGPVHPRHEAKRLFPSRDFH